MNSHKGRAFCLSLATITMALAAPLAGHGQTINGSQIATSAAPAVRIFLADPELGVVGAYQSGGSTLYFETRIPNGSTEMSVRLVDSQGDTVAISGHSMDARWEAAAQPSAAVNNAASWQLARSLSLHLAQALDQTVFASETQALVALANGGAQREPAATLLRMDSATANMVRSSEYAAAAANYDREAAKAVSAARNINGIAGASFAGVMRAQTVVQSFPDGENENGEVGRTEINARILASDGTSLAQQFGGDTIPLGWYDDAFRNAPTTDVDPIAVGAEIGTAIRAAALISRYPGNSATAAEAETIGNLAGVLRDDGGMLPNSALQNTSETDSASPDAVATIYVTNIYVEHKALAAVAQHSGTVVSHYYSHNNGASFVFQYETVYCNHGTCPGASGMGDKANYNGPRLNHYRYAPHYAITAAPPSPPSGFHSCAATPYHLFSGQFWPVTHGHNCNDDSWTQIRAIKGESFDTSASDNPLANGARCDNHDAEDPRAPGPTE